MSAASVRKGVHRKVYLIHPSDNVATALVNLGEEETVKIEGLEIGITVKGSIPFGHKVALVHIPRGGRVIKYGEVIGLATQDIAPGEHVHTHNLTSQRGGSGVL